MAGSTKNGKLFTALIVKKLYDEGAVKHVLDIGAGSGTYSNLARAHMPNSIWHAVEVWEPYIAQFDLPSLYDEVHLIDARKLDLGTCDTTFDLVFCGDVLEHMEKEEAIALMDHLLSHAKIVLASIPIVHYPQGAVHGNPYEAHVKDDWSHQEMIESFPDITATFIQQYIGVYLLTRQDELKRPLAQLNAVVANMVKKQNSNDAIYWS